MQSGTTEYDIYKIEFKYSYDPGVHTYSNGDPGYPPNEESEIERITTTNEEGAEIEVEFDSLDKETQDGIMEKCYEVGKQL